LRPVGERAMFGVLAMVPAKRYGRGYPNASAQPKGNHMAKQALPKLNWTEVDPASLDAEAQALLNTSKAKYREAKAAREAFEAYMQRFAPEGKRLVFGYNFGKLSMAIAEAVAAVVKASKGAVSFSQLIARR